MLNTILATKDKMGATFVESTRVAVTWVKAGPCIVTQIKKPESDGYWAVQVGYGDKKTKNISNSLRGHFRKITNNSELITKNRMPRYLREIKLNSDPDVKVGDVITLTDVFKKGDVITVTGTSKGKGFAGVVKRWRFAGGPKTHGQSDRQRAPGSIGQGTTPGRVYKGKKMAGRMGQDTVTIKNLVVVDLKPEENLLAVSGPVPGISGGLLSLIKLAEGNLEELVEEAPQVEVQEVEEEGKSDEKLASTESTEKTEDTEKEE